MSRRLVLLGIVLVAAAAGASMWLGRAPAPAHETARRAAPARRGSTEPRESRAARPTVAETPRHSNGVPRASTRTNSSDEEALLMKPLRGLVETDPSEAIALAREAESRFPQSERASEREWSVVKALVNLKRFHEARDLAQVMVDRYPGDPWAAEVERHLLVYPLDQPSREEMQLATPQRRRAPL